MLRVKVEKLNILRKLQIIYISYFYIIVLKFNKYYLNKKNYIFNFEKDYCSWLQNNYIEYSIQAYYFDKLYIWNKLRKINWKKRKKLFHESVKNLQVSFYYNVNALLGVQKFDIDLFYKQKFANISYFFVRLYIYIMQNICNVKINYYYMQIKKKTVLNLIFWKYFNIEIKRLSLFLKRFGVTNMFIIYFVRSVLIRDIEAVLSCIRKVLIYINRKIYRQFLFVYQVFFKKIFSFLEIYCGLRGYRIEVKGKFGRGGSGRTKKYLLYRYSKSMKSSNYYSYSYLQIKLLLGAMGLRGILLY